MLRLPAAAENLGVIRRALAGVAKQSGAGEELVDDIRTAANEAATNAIAHAYPVEGGEGLLEVAAELEDRWLEVAVRDFGIGMQPRPLEPGQPSLRIGLALIGALSDSFEVTGHQGEGTEVRIGFDLDRSRALEHEPAEEEPERAYDLGETTISTRAGPGGGAIGGVMEMLAARSNLDLNQLSDIQLLADQLAAWNSASTVNSRSLEIAIIERDAFLDIRIGPLEPGMARRLLESSEIPGLGNTLERVSDKVEVKDIETSAGPAEYLNLEIGQAT